MSEDEKRHSWQGWGGTWTDTDIVLLATLITITCPRL